MRCLRFPCDIGAEETVLYRDAVYADAFAIATLHAESWRTNYRGAYRDEFLDGDVLNDRIEVWKERLSKPSANQLVVVAEDAERVVGFVCAFGADDQVWGTLLDNLHVSPDGQGQGLGTRLVSEVGAWCRRNYPGCGLYLWVLDQNAEAQRFYRGMGATDRGGELSEPPGGGQIAGRRYVWSSAFEVPRAADQG